MSSKFDAESDVDDRWFVYRKVPGRTTAMPLNWKGWLSFLACISATVAAGMVIHPIAFGINAVAGFVALFATIVGGVLLTLELVVAKGRPSR